MKVINTNAPYEYKNETDIDNFSKNNISIMFRKNLKGYIINALPNLILIQTSTPSLLF